MRLIARGGVNYTRTCSQPVPDEHCSFPGPPEVSRHLSASAFSKDDGNATYFWGFATAIARVEADLRVVLRSCSCFTVF